MFDTGRKPLVLLCAIALTLSLLIPLDCFAAKRIEWENIDSVLEIKGGHRFTRGPLIVKLMLPETIIAAAQEIVLFIDYTGVPSADSATGFTINNSNKIYRFKPRVAIATKHLKTGKNVFKFDAPNSFFF